jgi:hypothetical protein
MEDQEAKRLEEAREEEIRQQLKVRLEKKKLSELREDMKTAKLPMVKHLSRAKAVEMLVAADADRRQVEQATLSE